MNSAARLILGCALLVAAAPVTAQQNAHDRLFRLFKESDEGYLQRNPLQALYRGDYRYADRLGDLYSDAHYRAEKAAAERELAELAAIPRTELNADDQLAYDVFEFQTKDTLRELQPDLLPLVEALPMNHFYGLHTEYPTVSSGQGGAPYATVTDYENGLKRNRDFARNVDQAIAQARITGSPMTIAAIMTKNEIAIASACGGIISPGLNAT